MEREFQILLVDDSPQDRRLVMRELQQAYPAAAIREAIDQSQLDEALDALEFDVVVTDYHLMWSDGIRVLQAVKQRVPNCPVIMFTATGNEEVAVKAMKQGLDDYIIKNVRHLVRLRGAVDAALKHSSTKARANHLEARLESLLLQLNVGVFSCAADGRLLEVNDPMIDMLGCATADDALETSLASLIGSETRARGVLDTVLKTGLRQECEFERTTASGETRFYRLGIALVGGGPGVRHIEGLVEDVTQHMQLEAEARLSAVAAARIAMLSPREHDVLDEVVSGRPNKAIAAVLGISSKTVEKHRSNLMKKLQVRNIAELLRIAMLAESARE